MHYLQPQQSRQLKAPVVEEPAVEEAVADESTEVTDPDDIDALLAAAAEPAVEEAVAEEKH